MTRALKWIAMAALLGAGPQALAQTATEQPADTATETPKVEATETPATPTTEAPATPATEAPATETADDGAAPQEPEKPSEVVTAVHTDWNIVCASTNIEACVMLQQGKDAEGRDVMEVRIRRLKDVKSNGQKVDAAIQIAVPLGVLLTTGVELSIDGSKPSRAPFRVCDRGGCLVQEALANDVINRMKKGAKATFTIHAPPERKIPVNISLSGFTAAYNALTAR